MQEDDLPFPLLHPHGGILHPAKPGRQGRHLVEMGGEKRPATIDLVQVLDGGKGDGQAVIGRRSPADLVEDDQRPFAGLVEDRRRLDHLDHEGRASFGEIVGSPHPAEQPVDDPDMGPGRRHVGTDLGKHGHEGVLAQEGRLAAHVRPGQQPDRAGVGIVGRRQIAVIGDERVAAPRLQRSLDHRMPAAFDMKRQAVVDERRGPVFGHRKLRESRGDVEHGQRLGAALDRVGAADDGVGETVEGRQFDAQRLGGRARDPAFEFRQLGRREAHGGGHGLAVDEAGDALAFGESLRLSVADLDEIAEHVVVLDPQIADAGLGGVAPLQFGDHPAGILAQGAGLVEFGDGALAHEATVALEKRHVVGQRRGQRLQAMARQRRQSGGGAGKFGRQIAVEAGGDRHSGLQPVADRGKVARTAAAQRQPRQRPLRVRQSAQCRAQALAGGHVDDEMRHRSLALADRRRIGQRPGEAPGEKSPAGAGDGPVDGGEKTALPLAGNGAGELQRGAGRRIDLHERAGRNALGPLQGGARGQLGLAEIGDQRRPGGQLDPRETTEAFQRRHAEEPAQPLLGSGAVEQRLGLWPGRAAEAAQ